VLKKRRNIKDSLPLRRQLCTLWKSFNRTSSLVRSAIIYFSVTQIRVNLALQYIFIQTICGIKTFCIVCSSRLKPICVRS